MPYARRYRKRNVRRRRTNRRRIARVPRTLAMPSFTMKVKRKFWWFNWTLSTASTPGFWRYLSISLSDMPSNAEIVNLFDQYKITGIRYELHPRFDSFAGNDTVDTTQPGITNQAGVMVHVVNDPRSLLTPSGTYTAANLNTFMEQGRVKTHRGIKPVVIYHKPTISQSQTTGSRQIRAPWLQTANTTVVHSGAHVFTQDVNLTGISGQSYDVFVTMYMLCRGSR